MSEDSIQLVEPQHNYRKARVIFEGHIDRGFRELAEKHLGHNCIDAKLAEASAEDDGLFLIGVEYELVRGEAKTKYLLSDRGEYVWPPILHFTVEGFSSIDEAVRKVGYTVNDS